MSMNGADGKRAEVRGFILLQIERRLARFGGQDRCPQVDEKTSVLASGLFDSLAFLDLLADLESHFSVEVDFSDHDPAFFTSPEGLTTLVMESLQKSQTPAELAPMAATEEPTYQSLSPEHPAWPDLQVLFGEMYAGFEKQGLLLQLRPDGSRIWMETLSNSHSSMQFVAGCLQGACLAGFVHATVRISPPHLQDKFTGFIEAVYVRQSHRGEGIATELVRHAEQWFKSKNVRVIHLQVLSQNETAMRFWTRAGFHVELSQLAKGASGL